MQTDFAHVHDQTRFGGDTPGAGPEGRGGEREELLRRKKKCSEPPGVAAQGLGRGSVRPAGGRPGQWESVSSDGPGERRGTLRPGKATAAFLKETIMDPPPQKRR